MDGFIAAFVAAVVAIWIVRRIFFRPLPYQPTGTNPDARIVSTPHTKSPRR
jgi:hypothetical protein